MLKPVLQNNDTHWPGMDFSWVLSSIWEAHKKIDALLNFELDKRLKREIIMQQVRELNALMTEKLAKVKSWELDESEFNKVKEKYIAWLKDKRAELDLLI